MCGPGVVNAVHISNNALSGPPYPPGTFFQTGVEYPGNTAPLVSNAVGSTETVVATNTQSLGSFDSVDVTSFFPFPTRTVTASPKVYFTFTNVAFILRANAEVFTNYRISGPSGIVDVLFSGGTLLDRIGPLGWGAASQPNLFGSTGNLRVSYASTTVPYAGDGYTIQMRQIRFYHLPVSVNYPVNFGSDFPPVSYVAEVTDLATAAFCLYGTGLLETTPSPPAAPASLTTTGPPVGACLGATVPLAWAVVTGAVSYTVRRGGVILQAGITGTSYTDSSVIIGMTYTYVVTAVNAGGESLPSTALVVTPCGIGSVPGPGTTPAEPNSPPTSPAASCCCSDWRASAAPLAGDWARIGAPPACE